MDFNGKKRNLLRLLSGILILFIMVGACSSEDAPKRPNIVIIYGDDVGYGDIGAYGSELVPTPEIDQMASEGLLFTDAYSTAATCTPSRYSMLTGEYAFRNDRAQILSGAAPLLIKPGSETLPAVLKRAGYHTSVIGKWHLGLGEGKVDWNSTIKPGPLEVGFDESFLIPATNDRVPTVYVKDHQVYNLNEQDDSLKISYDKKIGDLPTGLSHPELLKFPADTQHSGTIVNGISRIGWQSGGQSAWWKDEEMADILAGRSAEFIEKNKGNPFFLFLSLHEAHVPRAPNSRFREKSKTGRRGDAIFEMDWIVGQVLKKLDELNLREKTLVVFSSDNGPIFDDGYTDGAIKYAYGKPEREDISSEPVPEPELLSPEEKGGHQANGPLRGGKYHVLEGGTRVPMVVSWPGTIAEGSRSGAIISQVDLLASLADLAGVELSGKAGVDSQNLLPVLLGESKDGRKQVVQQGVGALSIRRGKWKLIPAEFNNTPDAPYDVKHNNEKNPISTPKPDNDKSYLFNLEVDPGETTNVAEKNPQVVDSLLQELRAVLDGQANTRAREE